MKDEGLYEVEAILDHRGSFKLKTHLEFHVLWRGYSVDDATWECWKNVKDNALLHAYLRKIGKSAQIPEQYRDDSSVQT